MSLPSPNSQKLTATNFDLPSLHLLRPEIVVTLHDAEILAEVYLAMTGGQVALAIDDNVGGGMGGATEHQRFSTTIKRFLASSDAEQAHLEWLNALKDNNPQLAENWASV